MKLAGRSALVTGGTRGIGLAISRALRREGASVVAITEDLAQVDEFNREFAADDLASARVCDVRDREALEALRDTLAAVDILVPNAGVTTRGKALDISDEAVRHMSDVNLYGVMATCQVFAPLVNARPGSRVIVTSSVVALHAMDVRAFYAATKAGVSGFVRALAVEWGRFGTTVNAVGPGIIETPMTAAYIRQHQDRVEPALAAIPLRRFGTPEDVAGVVVTLASDAGRFMTGQTVFVDGGLSAGSAWW